jgi:dTDP-4-dehydrorhamnose reductase
VPRLLITGVSGYLGTAVAARAAGEGWDVAGTFLRRPPGHAGARGVRAVRLDVRDERAVAALIAAERPDAVIHTAYVQDGPDALAVNAGGAAHVAAATAADGVRLVHLSSDAVFAGDLGRGLREDDPVDPVTAYGATKAAAEAAVARADPGALAVRTSLLFGGPGRPPSKHERLAHAAARGEREVAFFADEIRCPAQVDDLAGALLELAAARHAGVLHVAGADALDRHAFARLCAAAAGLDPGRLTAGTRPPGRPGDCTLDCSRARALLATRLRGARAVLG